MRLLLASRSETRRRMLEAAGVPFDIAEASFDEDVAKARLRREGLGAAELALALAEAKARAVDAGAGVLVLGADQTLEGSDGAMFDKPASRPEAKAQLQALAGTTHRLHSAAVLAVNARVAWCHTETATLTMRPLGAAFLERYLDREYQAIRWGVGGYRIEGLGAQLFERVEGSHFAVLGLPLLPLLGYLRERGVLAS